MDLKYGIFPVLVRENPKPHYPGAGIGTKILGFRLSGRG